MVASKLKLMFLIQLLSLQLSAILSKRNDDNNGMSMNLHTRSNERFAAANDDGEYERFARIVEASKNRARALKGGILYHRHQKRKSLEEISVEESLYYPSDFIEYYIKLSVGTPAQDLFLIMDTGSSVVWTPCTSNYTCNNCHGFSTAFLPSESSSAVPVNCSDQKCRDVCGDGVCIGSVGNCSGDCPGYALYYGSGNTTGHLLTETLVLPALGRGEINNFGIGCSVVSFGFAGIAGFGRGGLSVPSQLSFLLGDKFAYCLDDLNNSSMILLGDIAVPTNISLNYTPFLNKSEAPSFKPYSEFYYVGLQGVSIGGKNLTLPSNLSTVDSNGNGGTVIDSGTSFTVFPGEIYNQIVGEFVSQTGYRRAGDVEVMTGMGLCFNVSGVENANIQLPEFVFHFNGGSDMVLPNWNSFALVRSDAICLTMVNSSFFTNPVGPAVLLGNYQQQNFYILYDRENNSLGFTQQACKALG